MKRGSRYTHVEQSHWSEIPAEQYLPDPELGDCGVGVDELTCAAAPGENCSGLMFMVCATPPPACTPPTDLLFSTTVATCSGASPQNDGLITLTQETNATHYAISSLGAMSYDGETDVNQATPIVGGVPVELLNNGPNAGGTYIIRIFNTESTCFTDVPVTLGANECMATCALTIDGVSASSCDAQDNSYDLTVSVTYTNAPVGEGIRISTSSGDEATFTPDGSGDQDFVISGLTSDGVMDIDVTAAFETTTSCADTELAAYDAPDDCTPAMTISISDPCSCNQTQIFVENASAQFPYFYAETVEIMAGPGATWRVIAGPAPGGEISEGLLQGDGEGFVEPLPTDGSVLFTESATTPGTYTLDFFHLDQQGYNIVATDGTDTLTIGATCVSVPQPPDLELQFEVCNADEETQLATVFPNGTLEYYYQANLDTFEFQDGVREIDLLDLTTPVPGAILNPADYASFNRDNHVFAALWTPSTADPALTDCPRVLIFNVMFQEDGVCASCDLNITAVTPSCSYTDATGQSTFSVQVDLSWDYANLPTTAEAIDVTFNGMTMSTAAQNTETGTASVTFTNVPGPAYDLLVEAAFATTTSCSDATTVDLIACTPDCVDGLGGNVFNDFDNDGADAGAVEVGQENVLVEVYDCDNNLVCTTWTNADGNWTCDNLTDGEDYRVEFSTPLQDYLQPSFAGTDNGTNTQFVEAPSCEVDYGVIDPSQYCEENPMLVTNCYLNGTQDGGVIVSWNYNDAGLISGGRPAPTYQANNSQVGTTWGLAYETANNRVFTAAFLKRHSRLLDADGDGNGDLGAIYEISMDGNLTNDNSPLWLNLEGTTDTDGNTIAVGSIANDAGRGITGNGPSHDPDAFDKVGKVGLGDIDLNATQDELWVVNLFEKKLHGIAINADGSPGAIRSFDIPVDQCNGTGTENDARPFGVRYYQGAVYVGVVCSGENTGQLSTMDAYVYRLDDDGVSTTFTEVLSFPLNYLRDVADTNTGCNNTQNWLPWASTFPAPCCCNGRTVFPQPLLSDIEFDLTTGEMIIGFIDRFGHQSGFDNYSTDTGSTMLFGGVSGGEILKSTPDGDGTFTIENLSTTSALEFYIDDFFDTGNGSGHFEIGIGGLAILPGGNRLISTAYDPINGQGNQGVFISGGTIKLDNTTGAKVNNEGYQIFNGNDAGTLGKAAGLGDLELLCDPAPIQIGNFVFIDEDDDNVQDICDTPVENLPVSLYTKDDNGTLTLVATTTTDEDGEYYFTGDGTPGETWENTGEVIISDTTYLIVFGDTPESNTSFTFAGTSYGVVADSMGIGTNPTLNDSDGTFTDVTVNGMTQRLPAICYSTADTTDHTLDLGLRSLCEAPTMLAFVPVPADCSDLTQNNNGRIVLTRFMDADRFGVSQEGMATYDGPDYGTADTIVSVPLDLLSNVPNTGGTYVVRIFNGDDGCFTDTTIVVPEANCPVDPQGFIYCEETGEIITGGQISVSGPGTFVIALDGSTGEYQFFTDGTEGVYTLTYTPPAGFALSTSRTAATGSGPGGAFDPTPGMGDNLGGDDPIELGSGTTDGELLDDFSAAANPFYLSFDFAMDDPEIFLNNIPLTGCGLSLGSTIFEDSNNNGLQDSGEDGIAQVQVQLFSPGPDGMVGGADDEEIEVGPDGVLGTGDDAVGGMPTSAAGDYFFQGLPTGDYYLQISSDEFMGTEPLADLPISSNTASGTFAGETDPDDNRDNDDEGLQTAGRGTVTTSNVVSLAANVEPTDAGRETAQAREQDNNSGVFDDDNGNMTLDMGFFAPVSVGDTAFVDLDGDGLQTPGEPGIGGVTVTLLDSNGDTVTVDAEGNMIPGVTTTSVLDGSYLFENLPPGEYSVIFDISTAADAEFYEFTTPNAGDDTDDSDNTTALSDSTAQSDPTPFLNGGAEDLTLDVGLRCATEVVVVNPFTICVTQLIDLTQDAAISPAALGGNWSTPDGGGEFLDASGRVLTAPFSFGTAVSYRPGAADARRGEFTLVLTSNDPSGPCEAVSASVTIQVLRVGCGQFYWDGE